jgi:steroid delta-isomerase-like uncharacterized protein
MSPDELKSRTLESFELMFGQGDLDHVDASVAAGAVDHQSPPGTDMVAHLRLVVRTLRDAFPDLRFDVHEVLCEGDVVACRSTMTGTHRAPLRIGPMAGLPVEGVAVEVPHMHFFRYDEAGRVTDLWHVWDTLRLARQLGAPAPDLSVAA